MISKFLVNNSTKMQSIFFRSFSSKAQRRGKNEAGFMARSKGAKEILPILVLIVLEAVNIAWFIPYYIATRQEAPLYLGPRQDYPFDCIETLRNPSHPKLLQYNQVYEPLPDLARIYEDMQKKEDDLEECEEDEEEAK